VAAAFQRLTDPHPLVDVRSPVVDRRRRPRGPDRDGSPQITSADPDQVPARSALDERPPGKTLHPLLVEFQRLEALPAQDEAGLVGIRSTTFSHAMTIGTLAAPM